MGALIASGTDWALRATAHTGERFPLPSATSPGTSSSTTCTPSTARRDRPGRAPCSSSDRIWSPPTTFPSGDGDRPLTAALDGRPVQRANTSDLHFDVATPVAHAGDLTPLEPGDLITTGTPGGTLSHPLAPAGTSTSPSRVWMTSTASWRHRCPDGSTCESTGDDRFELPCDRARGFGSVT
ncbi:fumarylacetoacetate hydrolase family protein [Streptomyces sp. NPDC056061]|uniref:fumarylacetoacetate hydrolase family protein n=1 Tax=Streptomyces sp. NPDC056061 TaxID=3345700 RepID=UPI0035DF3E94